MVHDRVMDHELLRVRQALTGSVLAGRELTPVAIPESPDLGFEITVSIDELVPAWAAARARASVLRRWPVAIAEDEPYSRFFFEGSDDRSPGAVLRRASRLNPREVLDRDPDDDIPWEDLVQRGREETERRVGCAPARADIDAAVPIHNERALEYFLLRFEEDRRPMTGPEPGGHLTWFTHGMDRCRLQLVPVTRGAHTLAYISWFGASWPPYHEGAIRVLEDWEQRYGAELVANWGTMLQLVVSRPPGTIEDAFALACEHQVFSVSTLGLPGVSIRNHARSLLHRRDWFFHERP
jgi:hypothetical protein